MTELKLIEVPLLIEGAPLKKLNRPLIQEDFDKVEYITDAFDVFHYPLRKFPKSKFTNSNERFLRLSCVMRFSKKTLNAMGDDLLSRIYAITGDFDLPIHLGEQQKEEASRCGKYSISHYIRGMERCRKFECVRRKVLDSAQAIIKQWFQEYGQREHLYDLKEILNQYQEDRESVLKSLRKGALSTAQEIVDYSLDRLNSGSIYKNKRMIKESIEQLDEAGRKENTDWDSDLKSLKKLSEDVARHKKEIEDLRVASEQYSARIRAYRQGALAERVATYSEKYGELPDSVHREILEALDDDRLYLPSVD